MDIPTLEAIQAAIPTGTEVTVGLANDQLPALAADPAAAIEALEPLAKFGPMIRYVAVGSEPNEAEAWEGNATALAAVVLPALANTAAALQLLEGLEGAKAVVPLTMAVVEGFRKPHLRRRRRQRRQRKQDGGAQLSLPTAEQGRFDPAWDAPFMQPLLRTLSASGSVLMMNIHPYSVYKDHARGMDISFATGSIDSSTSLLDQLLDTVSTAVAGAGFPALPIVIGETGWPTAGGVGASTANACHYMQSTVGRTARGRGVEVFLFEAFDEEGKEAVWGGIEAHWGVLAEDGGPKYPMDWAGGEGATCA